jgi:hypothetical protein
MPAYDFLGIKKSYSKNWGFILALEELCLVFDDIRRFNFASSEKT